MVENKKSRCREVEAFDGMQQSMSSEHQRVCTRKECATKEEGPESDTRALFTASLNADRLFVLVVTVSCGVLKRREAAVAELHLLHHRIHTSRPKVAQTFDPTMTASSYERTNNDSSPRRNMKLGLPPKPFHILFSDARQSRAISSIPKGHQYDLRRGIEAP